MAVIRGALAASLALVCILLSPAIASALPTSHITERMHGVYYPNGSLYSFSSAGYVEVAVGNTKDVMQYLIINLSKTNNTNLLSRTAFRSVAASPTSPQDKTRLFLNTTSRPDAIEYNITNSSLMTVIYIQLDYLNKEGGQDIYSGGMNNFSMNITFNSTRNLNGATLVFQLARDTVPATYDAMDIYFANASSGSFSIIDTDLDGFRDLVNWTDNMVKGTQYTIHLEAYLTPGVNFNETFLSVPMGGTGSALYAKTRTFTGITFSNRFSRGPIREGVEMAWSNNTQWNVRGMIRNIAEELEYVVNNWALYEVGNFTTPFISSTTSRFLNTSNILYTRWTDNRTSKPYFAASFDWEVVWGGSVYKGEIEGSIIMPTLYEIDPSLDKTVTVQSNDAGGTSLLVRDMLKHLGHSSLEVNNAFMHSIFPNASVGGTQRNWSASNVTVYYANNTGWYDITSSVLISTKDSDSGKGYVDVNITNVTALVGRALQQNEKFYVSYTLSSLASDDIYNYTYGLNATLVTTSGTPVTKYLETSFVVPGIVPPPPPPVVPPGVVVAPEIPVYYADIIKEFAELVFLTPFLVEVDTSFVVMDTGTKGIKDISLAVYVPGDGVMETDRMSLVFYRSSTDTIEYLTLDQDYLLEDNGQVPIGDKMYTEYLIKRIGTGREVYSGGWTMADGDKVKLKYRAKVPFGTHSILTRVIGYDYYRDATIAEDAYIMFRRELEIKKFLVDEGEFVQEKAVVGKPVTWVKKIVVENPNQAAVTDMIESVVFPDTMSVYVVSGDGKKEDLELQTNKDVFVSWGARLDAGKTMTYFLSVVTPPVLEISRVADILDYNKTLASIFINSTLENFALENYTNISFFFEGRNLEIISVEGGNYTVHNNSLEVHVPPMASGEKHDIIIVYKEIPPILILLLDKLKYNRGQDVEGTIIFIPGESTSGGYLEYEITGPGHKPEAVYLDIISNPSLSQGNETRVVRKMGTWNKYSGEYIAYAKYRKEFATILFAEKRFKIEYPELPAVPINPWILLAIFLALVIYLISRIYKRRTYRKEVSELREDIRKL